jgi:hypothetical protein
VKVRVGIKVLCNMIYRTWKMDNEFKPGHIASIHALESASIYVF